MAIQCVSAWPVRPDFRIIIQYHAGVEKMNANEDKALIGKALTLADLVDYQDGAVVSRTIIDKEKGTVTVFSFDAGQGLSEHTAPFDAMVCVLDGVAQVNISGEPHRVEAGQMIIMPADRPHSLHAPERFKMLLVMVRQ